MVDRNREERAEQRKGYAGKLGRAEGTVRSGSIECSVTRKENANARVRQTAPASRACGANEE